MLKDFFLFKSVNLYVTSVGLSIFFTVVFGVVVKFGFKTYVPNFKFVAGLNREFILSL